MALKSRQCLHEGFSPEHLVLRARHGSQACITRCRLPDLEPAPAANSPRCGNLGMATLGTLEAGERSGVESGMRNTDADAGVAVPEDGCRQGTSEGWACSTEGAAGLSDG